MTGRRYTADTLPWWELTTPTVDGRRRLSCLHADDEHTAARVAFGTLVLCSGCTLPVLPGGHCWADEAREVVLCGPCHERRHAAAARYAADVADAIAHGDELPGQLGIEL